jgi:prepilin-type N-terminal cleavage/methylation domain-containing protein
MKKRTEITLPKVSADQIAKQLKKGMGKERALHIAEGFVKNLKGVGIEDVNKDIFKMKDIRKSERVWTQVRDILANQKGFTAFELVFCLAILGVLCVGLAEIGVIAHFVRKFW